MRYAIEGGTDAEHAVVLVHGVGSNLTAWDGVTPLLAKHFRVVRYSLPGHGGSTAGNNKYTLDSLVETHLAVLAKLGIARAHLVGFSLGGLIAQAIAITHPQTVDRLVVISAVAGRTPEERANVLARLDDARKNGPPQSADRWFTDEFLQKHPETVARNLKRMQDTDPEAYASAYEVLATNDLADDLAKIEAPTLAMTGEHDVGSPPHMAERIATTVQNGRLRILNGLKHGVLDEAPNTIADEIVKFLEVAG